MKGKLAFAVGLALLFVTACSSISVNYDYDTENNFSNYTTYKWLRKKNMQAKDSGDFINYNRIRKAVNSELAAEGFKLKDKGKPDFFVIAYSGFNNKSDVSYWGYSYEPQWDIYESNYPVSYYKEGTLVIDIINAKTKELVWRGAGKKPVVKNYSPKEKMEIVKKVVNKILENFPPKN